MRKGESLRSQIENVIELMSEVENFLRTKRKLTKEAAYAINEINENSEDLYYMIPLEE